MKKIIIVFLLVGAHSVDARHAQSSDVNEGQKMFNAVIAARATYQEVASIYEKCKKEKPVETKKCEEIRRRIKELEHMANFMAYGETFHGSPREIESEIADLQKQLEECRHSACTGVRQEMHKAHQNLKEKSRQLQEWLKNIEK